MVNAPSLLYSIPGPDLQFVLALTVTKTLLGVTVNSGVDVGAFVAVSSGDGVLARAVCVTDWRRKAWAVMVSARSGPEVGSAVDWLHAESVSRIGRMI